MENLKIHSYTLFLTLKTDDLFSHRSLKSYIFALKSHITSAGNNFNDFPENEL